MSGWWAPLRIARRQVAQARARSLLVIALIGLPIFVLAGADVLYRTWQLDPSGRVTRQIGSADASVEWAGGHVEQSPRPDNGYGGEGFLNSPPPTSAEVRAALPAGSRVLAWRSLGLDLQSPTGGLFSTEFQGLDYRDPMTRGLVSARSGHAPRNDHELAVTVSLAADSGLRLGDVVTDRASGRVFRIVGTVADASYRLAKAAYGLPSALPEARRPGLGDERRWLVDSPTAITWSRVLHLNGIGFAVVSRPVYLHPPNGFTDSSSHGISSRAIAGSTVLAGLIVLEIVLLAGPAFAVGARRRGRDLGLLAAAGGERRHLRRVVLSEGAVLGVTAGVIATVLAVPSAALLEPLFARHVDAVPGHFDVPLLELVGLVLVAALTALLAAAYPAWRAARIDVVAALAGRRGSTGSGLRPAVAGAAVLGVGATLALLATTSVAVIAGTALAEFGLILCTPALLGLSARTARWLPVPARIAVRDAGRNRAAAAAAVAAVMASVIGAVAATINAVSADQLARDNYYGQLPRHDISVSLPSGLLSIDRVRAAVQRVFPDDPAALVSTTARNCNGGAPSPCSLISFGAVLAPGSQRFYGGGLTSPIISDGNDVSLLFGRDESAAAEALAAGHVVVMDSTAVHTGRVTVVSNLVGDHTRAASSRSVTVAATVVSDGFPAAQLILPRPVAAQLGLTPRPAEILIQRDSPPSAHQRRDLAAALQPIDSRLQIEVEPGYHALAHWRPFVIVGVAALVAILAALIATALAGADAASDVLILAAIGAAPRTRRTLAAARAGTIAGVGTVIGAGAALVPARAWIRSTGAPLVIPWWAIGGAIVVIPLTAAGTAWLCTRAAVPSERQAHALLRFT